MTDEKIIKILELIGSDDRECCKVGIVLFYQNKLDLQKERILKFFKFIIDGEMIRTSSSMKHWFSPYHKEEYFSLTEELDITDTIHQIINERT